MADVIVTLLARKGNKFDTTGETIGTHGRSIVFLPRGAAPDKSVRVKLIELEKKDSRGNTMYRAHPAPVEYVDRWHENGDGTISRVTYSIDWLLTEREEGVNETRPVATREVLSHTKTEHVAVWGATLVDSRILRTQTQVMRVERENIENKALVWKYSADRTTPPGPDEDFAALGIRITDEEWQFHCFKAIYPPDTKIGLEIDLGQHGKAHVVETWGSLPSWLQDEFMAGYPVCSCNRQRYVQQPDGYTRCQRCRSEETCDRCHHEQQLIKLVSGRCLCSTCEKMAGLEMLAENAVSKEERVRITKEATRLLTGKSMNRELAEMVLASTMDHFDQDASMRTRLLREWSGYAWYYFCDDGIYASKFSPEALQLLQHYARASGDGLVTMTAWIIQDDHTIAQCERDDFYWLTQVRGQLLQPSLSASQCSGEHALAVRLRGTEQDRQIAVTRFRALTATSRNGGEETRKIQEILIGRDQDYRAAITALDELDEALHRRAEEETRISIAEKNGHLVRKLDITCDTRDDRSYVWVIRPDGSTREHDGYGDSSHRRYTCYVWNLISDELVLVHNASVSGIDNFGSNTGIVWRPQQVTLAQIATVERLENEHGLHGTFEVNPALVAKRAKMMERIRNEVLLISPRENVHDLKFANISSVDGYRTNHPNPTQLVNWSQPSNARCESRDAHIVKEIRYAEGLLEFLVYDKWGYSNLNVRWRALTDDEKAATQPDLAAPKVEVKPVALTPGRKTAATTEDISAKLGDLFGGGAKARKRR